MVSSGTVRVPVREGGRKSHSRVALRSHPEELVAVEGQSGRFSIHRRGFEEKQGNVTGVPGAE